MILYEYTVYCLCTINQSIKRSIRSIAPPTGSPWRWGCWWPPGPRSAARPTERTCRSPQLSPGEERALRGAGNKGPQGFQNPWEGLSLLKTHSVAHCETLQMLVVSHIIGILRCNADLTECHHSEVHLWRVAWPHVEHILATELRLAPCGVITSEQTLTIRSILDPTTNPV